MLYKWDSAGTSSSDIEKVKEVTLASSGLKEKDLENIIAKKIDELVRTDQLMVIMQERSRQEEPDILAIDESGLLYIFELKRWEGRSENLLQVLRYGQKFGRYGYEKLNWFYQKYTHSSKSGTDLKTAHKEFFELDVCLEKIEFNKQQQFVVVTNGLDYDTWDAIAYWKDKGLRILPLIYRVFKVSGELYIDFDPYGPIPDAPKEIESGLFVVNTNKSYMPNAYKDMVNNREASAFYGKKYTIKKVSAGKPVCLYHSGVGIIGIGKVKTDFLIRDVAGSKDEEYYIPIDFEYLIDVTASKWQEKAVKAWEINSNFSSSHRFRQTVFQLPFSYTEFIKNTLKVRGVGS